MIPVTLPFATYGEFWPNGMGFTNLTLPKGLKTDLLHFRVSQDGRIVGQLHSPGTAAYWDGAQWIDLGPSKGTNVAAFHPTSGRVYVSTGDGVKVFDRGGNFLMLLPGYIGSQGIRQVLLGGTIISGDSTYVIPGLIGQYSIAGDLLIGQGIAGGVDIVWKGQKGHVCDGAPYFLRANEVDGKVTCYWTDFRNGYLLNTTIEELKALTIPKPPVEVPAIPLHPFALPIGTPVAMPLSIPQPLKERPKMIHVDLTKPLMKGVSGDKLPNDDGSVSVRKKNGYYLSVSPEGVIDQRPNDGSDPAQYSPGPWERFIDGGNALIAVRDNGTPEGVTWFLVAVSTP